MLELSVSADTACAVHSIGPNQCLICRTVSGGAVDGGAEGTEIEMSKASKGIWATSRLGGL